MAVSYTHLIHNKDVIADLEKKGIRVTEDLDAVPRDPVSYTHIIQQHTGIAVNETKIMVTGLKENSAKLS